MPFGWDSCPAPVREQVERLMGWTREELASSVVGLYLHGSLAMGCFNPGASDIDLLLVVDHALPPAGRPGLADYLLGRSGSPHPIELSVLTTSGRRPWRHPSPYDFHYSEDWREKVTTLRASGHTPPPGVDADLAAHITVLSRRGRCLQGRPITEVFPAVPR